MRFLPPRLADDVLASGEYLVERITEDIVKSRRSAVRRSKTDARALEGIAAASSGRQVLDETATEQGGEIVTPKQRGHGGENRSRRELRIPPRVIGSAGERRIPRRDEKGACLRPSEVPVSVTW